MACRPGALAAARAGLEHADRRLQLGRGRCARRRPPPTPARSPSWPVAMALFYTAGMILNDLLDYDVDLRERPERPLPSGRDRGRRGLTAVIVAVRGRRGAARARGREPAVAGLGADRPDRPLRRLAQGQPALAGAHGRVPRARLLRRRARRRRRGAAELWAAAAVLLLYIVGLTQVAKAEGGGAHRALADRWPCSRRPSTGPAAATLAVALLLAAFAACGPLRAVARARRSAGSAPASVRLIAGVRCSTRSPWPSAGGSAVALAVCLAAFAGHDRSADQDRGDLMPDKTVVLCTVALTPELLGDATPRLKAFADGGAMVPLGGVTPAVTAPCRAPT